MIGNKFPMETPIEGCNELYTTTLHAKYADWIKYKGML